MKQLIGKQALGGVFALMLLVAMTPRANAQEEVGGPYEPDENTVLLMHFDGDLTNISDASEDGTGFGTLSYVDNSALELGQALRIDNDSQSDSSYVTIPDTEALDLTGNWTIEGWINVFTFGETSDDWRWVPRLIIKPGEEVFWRPNFWIEMWGDNRFFSSGYHSASGCCWPQSNTPFDTMEPGQWYHITFVRDTTEQVIAQLVHNADRELIAFSSYKYDPIDEAPPMLNGNDVHIGWAGGASTDSWLDGFVDEVRISNVVRDFSIPPILADMTTLGNQSSDVTGYDVSIDAFKLGSGEVQDVTLFYDTGDGFQEMAMTESEDRTYTATIPGQSLGTVVRYYVAAEDDGGLRATFPSNVEVNEAYPSFGVFEPETQTLQLDFEGDSIDDLSQYGHEATFYANGEATTPTFSDDAAEGSASLELNSEDSAYVEIQSPFLASNELTVELWFKADSIKQDVRLIGKESTGSWFEQNFEIKFLDGNRISAGSFLPDGDGFIINELFLEDSLALDTWYGVQYVLADVGAALTVLDADSNMVGQSIIAVEGTPVLAAGPFRIGHSGPADQGYFDGKVDRVAIFNYAKEIDFSVPNEPGSELPGRLALQQNYPNPFNPSTRIRYTLPATGDVTLKVFDVLGRQVASLVDELQPSGTYEVNFDATQLSGGVYFYRLSSGEQTVSRSMLLLK